MRSAASGSGHRTGVASTCSSVNAALSTLQSTSRTLFTYARICAGARFVLKNARKLCLFFIV